MSQGLISNFRNISIKKNKNKSITSIKSIPIFHNQFPQNPSNLTIHPLIQTILSSTHNPLKSLQIHPFKSTPPTTQSLRVSLGFSECFMDVFVGTPLKHLSLILDR